MPTPCLKVPKTLRPIVLTTRRRAKNSSTMRRLLFLVVLLAATLYESGCANDKGRLRSQEPAPLADRRIANLLLAKHFPWKDDGACVVQNASREWSELARACFSELDQARVRFQDTQQVCPVAQTFADPATLRATVALCLFVQPELVLGAVIFVGVIMVAPLIVEALQAARSCWCMCASPGRLDGGDKVASPAACASYCAANYPGSKAVCK